MFQKLLKIERKHQRPKWKVGKRYEPFTKNKKKITLNEKSFNFIYE